MSTTLLQFACPKCRGTLRSRPEMPASLVVKCPRCSHQFALAEAFSTLPGAVPVATPVNQATVAMPPTATAIPAPTSAIEPTLRLPVEAQRPRNAPLPVAVPVAATLPVATPITAPLPVALPVTADGATIIQGSPTLREARAPDATATFPTPKPIQRPTTSKKVMLGVAAALLLGGGVFGVMSIATPRKTEKEPEAIPDDSPQVCQVAQKPPETKPSDKPLAEQPPDKDKAKPKPDPNPKPKPNPEPKKLVQGPPRFLLPAAPKGTPRVGSWVGTRAAELTGEDLNGKSFKLSDFRGKVAVLFFWADWCPYCRRSYHYHKAVSLKMAGRPFAMLGVNGDVNKDKARQAVKRDQLNWVSVFDGKFGPRSGQWASSLPSVFLIDQDGIIRKRIDGFDEPQLKLLIPCVEELLQEAAWAK